MNNIILAGTLIRILYKGFGESGLNGNALAILLKDVESKMVGLGNTFWLFQENCMLIGNVGISKYSELLSSNEFEVICKI
jgi:hypothetical protein